jgi:hypothetical protein
MSSPLDNRFVSVNIKNNDDLEMIETNIDDNNVCTICYSHIEDDIKTTLKCGHMYHTECYTTYIAYNVVNKKESITCPVCRNDIIEIVVNKPEVIQIITGDYDTEGSTGNEEDDIMRSGHCMSKQCCGMFILKSMMIATLYCVLHFTVYCTKSDSC